MAKKIVVNCPNKKCKSTNIVPLGQEKKLSVAGAVVGNFIAGPVGAVLGAASGKSGKMKFRCMDCGTVFGAKI